MNLGNDQGGGEGEFAASPISETDRYSFDVALADIDEDGDLDAVIANSGAQANQVLRNDGVDDNGIVTFTEFDLEGGHLRSKTVVLGDIDGDGDAPAVDLYGLPNINQDGLLPSMYVSETVDMSGLDALSETGSTEATLTPDNELSIEDVVVDAGEENMSVEEILNAYAGDNSAAENGASDTASSDPADQIAIAFNDTGSGAENYVPMADIMNTVDDGGTSGVNSDIIV